MLPGPAQAHDILTFAHIHQSDAHTIIETLQKLLAQTMDIEATDCIYNIIASTDKDTTRNRLISHWTAMKPAHCNDWLKAAPMSRQLTLTDREFQFAVRMRLNI